MKCSPDVCEQVDTELIRESPVTIYVNGHELVTLLCLARGLEYLTAGFLWSEGLVAGRDEIVSIEPKPAEFRVDTVLDKDTSYMREPSFKRLVTTACGKGSSFYSIDEVAESMAVNDRDIKVVPADVISLTAKFEDMSELHERTRGVHSALLAEGRDPVIFHDDIGRHNAIDKILGHAFLTDVTVVDKIVFTSGRVSSEVLLKVAKKGVPVLVSRAQPTDLAVSLADKLGITLIGFVRSGTMNVYSGAERVKA
jgi:FdhD protein